MRIEKEVKALTAMLEKAIPLLQARQDANVEKLREAIIAPHRGERHFWFGKIKTDTTLWVENAISYPAAYMLRDPALSKARKMLVVCLLADTIYVTCDSTDCKFIKYLTDTFPELMTPAEVFKAIP